MKNCPVLNGNIIQLNCSAMIAMADKTITELFCESHRCTKETSQLVERNNNEFQNLTNNQQIIKGGDNLPRIMNHQSYFASMITSLKESLVQLLMQFQRNHNLLANLQGYILKELYNWQSWQKVESNGECLQLNLSEIQKWFRTQYNLLCLNLRQIKDTLAMISQLNSNNANAQQIILLNQVEQLNQKLVRQIVQRAFILEQQPSQVIKKDTKFFTKCRFLLGEKTYASEVTVNILSQEQLKMYLENSPNNGKINVNRTDAGTITNNKANLQYDPNTDQVAAIFKDQKLSNIHRSSRNGRATVMDEKCYLIYQTNISFNGGEFVIPVWTISLPVVVIVHEISQAPQAWAVIMWDNAFRQLDNLFQVPEEVPWKQLKITLSRKFSQFTGTDCELTQEHLRFLATKLFGSEFFSEESEITWSQFCKDNLIGLNFTFWEWFFAAMKLTRDHLKEQWRDGLIEGFMFRNEAEKLLSTADQGTFILRFAESEPGYLAVVICGETSVYSSKIFPSDKFKGLSIAENISLCKDLVTLYGRNCNVKIFERYLSNAEKLRPGNGYVATKVEFSIIPTSNNLKSTKHSMSSCSSNTIDNLMNPQPIDENRRVQVFDDTTTNNINNIRTFYSSFSNPANSCTISVPSDTTNKKDYISIESFNIGQNFPDFPGITTNLNNIEGQKNCNLITSVTSDTPNISMENFKIGKKMSDNSFVDTNLNNITRLQNCNLSASVTSDTTNRNGYMSMGSFNASKKIQGTSGISTNLNNTTNCNVSDSFPNFPNLKSSLGSQNFLSSSLNHSSVASDVNLESSSFLTSPLNPLSVSSTTSSEGMAQAQKPNLYCSPSYVQFGSPAGWSTISSDNSAKQYNCKSSLDKSSNLGILARPSSESSVVSSESEEQLQNYNVGPHDRGSIILGGSFGQKIFLRSSSNLLPVSPTVSLEDKTSRSGNCNSQTKINNAEYVVLPDSNFNSRQTLNPHQDDLNMEIDLEEVDLNNLNFSNEDFQEVMKSLCFSDTVVTQNISSN